MSDDSEGKKFLELVDEQSSLQWGIVSKVSALIDSQWGLPDLKCEIQEMVQRHKAITARLNSIK